jgi:hypothetical protein
MRKLPLSAVGATAWGLVAAAASAQPWTPSISEFRGQAAEAIGRTALPNAPKFAIPASALIAKAQEQGVKRASRGNIIARESALLSMEGVREIHARVVGTFMEQVSGSAGLCSAISEASCEQNLSDAQKFALMEAEMLRDAEASNCARRANGCASALYPPHPMTSYAMPVGQLRPIDLRAPPGTASASAPAPSPGAAAELLLLHIGNAAWAGVIAIDSSKGVRSQGSK